MTDLQIWKRLEKQIAAGEKVAAAAYREALNNVRQYLASVYERLSEEGKLTQQILNKYGRFDRVQKEILSITDVAIKKSVRVVDDLAADMLREAFYLYQFTMENEIGTKVSFKVFDKQRAIEAWKNPMAKIATDRLKQFGRVSIRRSIAQGLEQGIPYRKMASQIRDAINGTQYDAMRIIRTEAGKAATKGQRLQVENAIDRGIEVKMVWDAALDSRTRPEHGRMDGVVAKEHNGKLMFYSPDVGWVDGPRVGGPAGFVINCRCAIRRERMEGPKVRRVGDKGEREVVAWKTYSDWKKERL